MANRKQSSKRSTSKPRARADDVPIPRDERDPGEYIRMRAYELYLERGDSPGDEFEDWIRAEKEHRERSAKDYRGEAYREESRP